MKSPLVSVIMPVYNGERYLRQAVDSILAQSYTDFELIVVEDGSTDNSYDILMKYRDNRIKVLRNDGNKGLMVTRNRAIEASQGKYIAFLDCDDVALTQRLEKQVAFLDAHPDFAMIGSWVEPIDEHGRRLGDVWKKPATPEQIPSILFIDNHFSQSSVMLRRTALSVGMYEESAVEDYDLWVRIARNYKTWNLQEVLIRHRLHASRATIYLGSLVWDQDKKVLRKQLDYLKIHPTEEELDFHWRLFRRWVQSDRDENFLLKGDHWLQHLVSANRSANVFDAKSFEAQIGEQWFLNCNGASGIGRWTWKIYRASPLHRMVQLTARQKVTFFLKCLIGKGMRKDIGVKTE